MQNNFYQRIITGKIILLVFFGSFFYFPNLFITLIQVIIPLFILIELKNLFIIKNIKNYLLAILYAFLPFTLVNVMYHNSLFKPITAFLFAITFTFDSACYISGKLIGKRKICPNISPGKTWGGFIGGYITLILLLSLVQYFNKQQIYPLSILFFAFICSFFALAGDILESWLKRKAKVKDSGSILPGHGGFLDRFDSVIFLAIIFYIFKTQIASLFF